MEPTPPQCVLTRTALEKDVALQLLEALRTFVVHCEDTLHSVCATNYLTLLDSINRISDARVDFDQFKVYFWREWLKTNHHREP